MKKQVKGFVLGVVFMLVISNTVLGDGIKKTIEIAFNSIKLEVNGKKIDADNILYNGTTYVPLRKAAELLGKEVDWNQETKTANIIDVSKDVVKDEPKDIIKKETVNYNNGDRYDGETKNGQRHGKGTYYYKNGEKYIGDWFTDFETGIGICYLANGNKKYEIDFVYGAKSGKITYYYEDGGRYEGTINNGILSFYGTTYFSDGSSYEGEYKDGKEHGNGKYTNVNGDYLLGEYIEGKFMNGVAQLTVNGITTTVYYENGNPIPSNDPIINTTNTSIIESRIDGEFKGWEGDTVFKLLNGQIWQQTSFSWKYSYKYSPEVLIYRSGLVYKMKVDGVDGEITVKRLK